jgi:hypothetical protein
VGALVTSVRKNNGACGVLVCGNKIDIFIVIVS